MSYTARHKIKITVADLRLLYKTLCKHQDKYEVPTNPYTWNSFDCSDCILSKILWQPKIGAEKDLCFLVWHEKIINVIDL